MLIYGKRGFWITKQTRTLRNENHWRSQLQILFHPLAFSIPIFVGELFYLLNFFSRFYILFVLCIYDAMRFHTWPCMPGNQPASKHPCRHFCLLLQDAVNMTSSKSISMPVSVPTEVYFSKCTTLLQYEFQMYFDYQFSAPLLWLLWLTMYSFQL